jgi:hypothetical protein
MDAGNEPLTAAAPKARRIVRRSVFIMRGVPGVCGELCAVKLVAVHCGIGWDLLRFLYMSAEDRLVDWRG